MSQKPKIAKDIVLLCVMLHNILRKHQGERAHPQNPQDDPPAINKQLLCLSDENFRIPQEGQKEREKLLKDYFNHLGALAG